MKPDGSLILNSDDPLVLEAKESSKKKTVTYGSDENTADVLFSNTSIVYEDNNGINVPIGVSFKVSYGGNVVPITLPGVLGVQHTYPVAAAIAVGLSQDVPFLNMTNSLANHETPKGRMNIVPGINNSVIIDDSYNAAPIAMQKAVEVLGEIETKGNKIAVLGDMLEIGSFSASEHKKIGKQVAESGVSFLVAVGVRSEYIAVEAIKNGMNEDKVVYLKTSEEAAEYVKDIIKEGSVILVKGSQGIRTEKVVVSIMADKTKRKELLVRQEEAWESR